MLILRQTQHAIHNRTTLPDPSKISWRQKTFLFWKPYINTVVTVFETNSYVPLIMSQRFLPSAAFICSMLISGCHQNENFQNQTQELNNNLPIVGLLVYDGFLMTEVTAPMDVFSKLDSTEKKLLNVVTVSEQNQLYTSEEGLTILPDFTFESIPKLDVLIVPSAFDIMSAMENENIINFIKEQNKNTTYTASNCAGAYLIGQSGIASGKKIVTYVGGAGQLQQTYPDLIVQDDSLVNYVEDGKFHSSNGNLTSYISSLELLEKLTSPGHRKYVEDYIYLDRLQNWNN